MSDEEDWVEEDMREEDECYYGFEVCIDSFCRDFESCLGCPLLKEEKVKP